MAAKLLLFLWKVVPFNFSIGGTLKRSTSAVWIFYNGFSPEKVNQDTVAGLFILDWQVRSFFSWTFVLLGKCFGNFHSSKGSGVDFFSYFET